MNPLDTKNMAHGLPPKPPPSTVPIRSAIPLKIAPAVPSLRMSAILEPATPVKIAPAVPSLRKPAVVKDVSMAYQAHNLPYQGGVVNTNSVTPVPVGPLVGYPPSLGLGGAGHSKKQGNKHGGSISSIIGQIAAMNGKTTPHTPHVANGAPSSNFQSAVAGEGVASYDSPLNFNGSSYYESPYSKSRNGGNAPPGAYMVNSYTHRQPPHPSNSNGNTAPSDVQFDPGNMYYQPGISSVSHNRSGHSKKTSVSFVTPANNGDSMRSVFPPVVLSLRFTPGAPQVIPDNTYPQPAVLNGGLASGILNTTPALEAFTLASTGSQVTPGNMYHQLAVPKFNVAPATPMIEPAMKALTSVNSVSFSFSSHLASDSAPRPSPYSLTSIALQLMQRDLRAFKAAGHYEMEVSRLSEYIHNTWNTMIERNNKMFHERTRCRRCGQSSRPEYSFHEKNHSLPYKALDMWRNLQKELADTNPETITTEGVGKFYDKYWDIERVFWEGDEAAGCGVPTWNGYHA